jgi:hypothetical protein
MVELYPRRIRLTTTTQPKHTAPAETDRDHPAPCFPTPGIRSLDSKLEQNGPKPGFFSPQNLCKSFAFVCLAADLRRFRAQGSGFEVQRFLPSLPPLDSAFFPLPCPGGGSQEVASQSLVYPLFSFRFAPGGGRF